MAKEGWGAAHVSSSHVEQEDDTIGSKQEPEKKGKGFTTNFPSKKNRYDHEENIGGFAGRISVRDSRNPICILANSSKTVLVWAPKVNRKKSFMVESAETSNLPLGVGHSSVTDEIRNGIGNSHE